MSDRHINLTINWCITHVINLLQPLWYQEVILSNTTSSMRWGSGGPMVPFEALSSIDKFAFCWIYHRISWLFTDFPIPKDFSWIFTEFPDFSPTLKNSFPLTSPGRWQPWERTRFRPQMDGQTDGRTDKMKLVYPLSTSLKRGYNNKVVKYFHMPFRNSNIRSLIHDWFEPTQYSYLNINVRVGSAYIYNQLQAQTFPIFVWRHGWRPVGSTQLSSKIALRNIIHPGANFNWRALSFVTANVQDDTANMIYLIIILI